MERLPSIAEPASAAAGGNPTSHTTTTPSTTTNGNNNINSDNNDNDSHEQQQQHAALGSQEEDALMNEMIAKHRTELTELQKYIGHASLHTDGDDDDNDDDVDLHLLPFASRTSSPDIDTLPPPPPPLSPNGDDESFDDQNESYDDLASPSGVVYQTPPKRSKTAERLLELSRTEEAALQNDRLWLADLSDVRNERIGRDVIHRWNPHAKVVGAAATTASTKRSPRTRTRTSGTASPRTSAKILGSSKDFVQQALDFNGLDAHDDTEEDNRAPVMRGSDTDVRFVTRNDANDVHDTSFRGNASQLELRTYVKQMEETIAQLVQQKDELLRNQAEFDKHASGIFPSLETLNHQLSQIVQTNMATSQVNIKEDVFDELRIQGEKLDELESAAKQQRHDAAVLEQSRALALTQIKGQIVSLVTSGALRDEKAAMLADSITKIERELLDGSKQLTTRVQLLEKRLLQLQSPIAQPLRVVPRKSSTSITAATLAAFSSALLLVLFAIATISASRSRCGFFTQCSPLT